MAKDDAEKKGAAASSQFAGGDYRGAVIDSAHMINLSAESSLSLQQEHLKQPKEQSQSNTQGIAIIKKITPNTVV